MTDQPQPTGAGDRPQFKPGSQWSYRAPPGFEASRLVVGAVVTFPEQEQIVCCAVHGAPRRRPDGTIDAVTIPFLPLSLSALAETVVAPDGTGALPDGFAAALAEWQQDPRGLSAFTVPFEGLLDRMIALQMASIAGAR
jgi:hypothetical protein